MEDLNGLNMGFSNFLSVFYEFFLKFYSKVKQLYFRILILTKDRTLKQSIIYDIFKRKEGLWKESPAIERV